MFITLSNRRFKIIAGYVIGCILAVLFSFISIYKLTLQISRIFVEFKGVKK